MSKDEPEDKIQPCERKLCDIFDDDRFLTIMRAHFMGKDREIEIHVLLC